MATRINIIILIILWLQSRAQTTDSLESGYSKFYNTSLLAVSSSGQYIVLNHINYYGKNEDELFDSVTKKSVGLGKNLGYKFLDDHHLMIMDNLRTRFQNLATNDFVDVPGNYTSKIITKSKSVLLYGVKSKELLNYSNKGVRKWRAVNVAVYEVDEKKERLIYFDGKRVVLRSLSSDFIKDFDIDDDIKWIRVNGDTVYFASIEPSKVRMYSLDLKSYKMTDQLICPDPAFEFAGSRINYFEIREGEHFIFPLYLKSKVDQVENSELRITYSNISSKSKVLNCHLGIYNLKNRQYEFAPEIRIELPVYKFLNEEGDFIMYDEGADRIENEENVTRDLKLFLDYGKSNYVFKAMESNDGSYTWDRNTRQFLYFKNERWYSRNIDTEEVRDILNPDKDGWNKDLKKKIEKFPMSNTIVIANNSSVVLSNQFDHFVLDLNSYKLNKITNGREKEIKYNFQFSGSNYSTSPWNIHIPHIDLNKELTFYLLDMKTYNSGFAKYMHKQGRTTFYNLGHYKEAIPFKGGMMFTSEFALEPLTVSKMEKNKEEIIYKASVDERQLLESMRCRILQYTTSYGTSNAALLFPLNYDKKMKYPMVVNVYENQSRKVFGFTVPNLRARDGFNYMHYLLNGYFVLLPDLQYDQKNIKDGIISSLQSSIDAAKLMGSIDEKNIGVLGISYGGYETGLALGNSKYFKTGVAGVMVSDLVSVALSNTDIMKEPNYMRVENQQFRMKESLFENWENYLDNSPIYHLNKVSTPVLIWTGLKDSNINPTQSKSYFLGMKRLQKHSILLEYVNETHNLDIQKNRLDANLKIFEWFQYYLKDEKPARWILPLIK
jgi:hypothetical protein